MPRYLDVCTPELLHKLLTATTVEEVQPELEELAKQCLPAELIGQLEGVALADKMKDLLTIGLVETLLKQARHHAPPEMHR